MALVTARAHTNIALVKYWGKRDTERNLPAVGSLSLTLDRFFTTSTLEEAERDSLELDGAPARDDETARVVRFLDLAREQAGVTRRFAVRSRNDVPTAAGLASSASAFAEALALGLDDDALTALARRGSGSAARSLHGGFVRLDRGERDDGSDCVARPCPTGDLDVRLLVVRCASGRKKIGSTSAMEHTRATSAYYDAWVATHGADLDEASDAVRDGDLPTLGRVMERSTLKMHACALGADPGIWYLAPTTVRVMGEVRALRDDGAACWFTMDAGPHVKVLCPAADADRLADALRALDGVLGVDACGPGPGARLVDGEAA
jgi:diphosphomevalonate decarboxylase